MIGYRTTSTIAFLSASCLLSKNTADAHGYLKTPRSRNYFASVEGVNWGTDPGKPAKEYCPHCINLKTEDQVCGTGQTQNYDDYRDILGNPMPWMSQAIFKEGQDIIVESDLTTNHAGHIDMFACPDGDDSTTACFRANPLTFVEDMLYGGPVDSDYPSRAYVAPVVNMRHKYRLPLGLTGTKVMLQWRYITANSCIPPGYTRPELGLDDLGWLRSVGMGECNWPPNETGIRNVGDPEQFWNCAEVTILPASPTISPSPTQEPVPSSTPTTAAPVATPVALPTPNTGGCCTWNNGESCGPTWCDASKSNCEGSCNGSYIPGSPTPPSPTAPTPEIPTGPVTPTAPTPTSLPVASTTRYWDCSGGACGCAYLAPNGDPAHCYSNAMFEAPAGNEYGAKFYGTAAISEALGGGNWMADGCGKCWKVRGWSNIPGKDIYQTTLVLKGTNFCPPINPACDGKPHFDISAPGFDVLQFSASNTCSEREPNEIEGFEACSRWMIDDQNSDVGCDCSKFNDPVLKAGCENFYSLLWDNSPVTYEEVNCPEELSRLNCWNENGGNYPIDIPEFCASNLGGSTPTPPTPTPPTPTPPTPTPPTPPTPPTNNCEDVIGEFTVGKRQRTCQWASEDKPRRCTKQTVAAKCPITCDTCDCYDSEEKVTVDGQKRSCPWLRRNSSFKDPYCSKRRIKKKCPVSCDGCDLIKPSPSESPSNSPGSPTSVTPTPMAINSDEYCCSSDLKTCNTDPWCDESEENCNGCSARWILKNQVCDLEWWDSCKENPDGCCPPAVCEDFGTWAQCRA